MEGEGVEGEQSVCEVFGCYLYGNLICSVIFGSMGGFMWLFLVGQMILGVGGFGNFVIGGGFVIGDKCVGSIIVGSCLVYLIFKDGEVFLFKVLDVLNFLNQ